jgi:hypothetical protein
MIYNGSNGKNLFLIDELGKRIPGVLSFDSDTQEVELVILSEEGPIVSKKGLLRVKTNIMGATLVTKEEYYSKHPDKNPLNNLDFPLI